MQRKIGLQPQIKNAPGRRWGTFAVQSRPSLRSVPGTNRPSGGPNGLRLNHVPEVGSGLPSTWGAGHLSGPPALRPQGPASSLQAAARSPPPEARVSSLRLVQGGTGPAPRAVPTRTRGGYARADRGRPRATVPPAHLPVPCPMPARPGRAHLVPAPPWRRRGPPRPAPRRLPLRAPPPPPRSV